MAGQSGFVYEQVCLKRLLQIGRQDKRFCNRWLTAIAEQALFVDTERGAPALAVAMFQHENHRQALRGVVHDEEVESLIRVASTTRSLL